MLLALLDALVEVAEDVARGLVAELRVGGAQLEEAAHPAGEGLGAVLRDAEHAGDDARRDLLRVVGGAIGAAAGNETIDERSAQLAGFRLPLSDGRDGEGRQEELACPGVHGRVGGNGRRADVVLRDAFLAGLRALGRRLDVGDEDVARREVHDVAGDVEEVLVACGHPRASPAIGVRDGACAAQFVPDGEGVLYVSLVKDIVVGGPVLYGRGHRRVPSYGLSVRRRRTLI